MVQFPGSWVSGSRVPRSRVSGSRVSGSQGPRSQVLGTDFRLSHLQSRRITRGIKKSSKRKIRSHEKFLEKWTKLWVSQKTSKKLLFCYQIPKCKNNVTKT